MNDEQEAKNFIASLGWFALIIVGSLLVGGGAVYIGVKIAGLFGF